LREAKVSLRLIHVELAEANAFVDSLHRHHKRVVGHKFSLGATATATPVHIAPNGDVSSDKPFGKLIGAAIFLIGYIIGALQFERISRGKW
jgi:hypothetical protein